MAARSPRRSFASPFVVTIAAALPACYVQPAAPPPQTPRDHTAQVPPDHQTPPPVGSTSTAGTTDYSQQQPQVHTNPPRPTDPTAQPTTPRPPVSSTSTAGNERPSPTTPTPTPAAATDRRWTVSKASGTCRTYIESKCPTAPKGQPQPTCNPPPPTAYTCPPNLDDNSSAKIVQAAGQTTCMIEYPMPTCPAGTMCNPPRPQKVPCPQ